MSKKQSKTSQPSSGLGIRDLMSPSMFWRPKFLDCSNPAWIGHIPFAFWIVESLKPRVFVELGTHTGNSYFAFCQAVDRLRLSCKCYAVDTWEGDKHAGFYGEEIFHNVDGYNSGNYSVFSTLIRSTFDQALQHFSDHSVDLLHIDGYHTFEAVSHDFNSWLPKMSTRGVILFHDTNVRRDEFGVARFFEVVRRKYESFEFHHSHGLGVLGVGPSLVPAIEKLFKAQSDSLDAEELHRAFADLGQACTDRADKDRLETDLGHKDRHVTELERTVAERTEWAKRLERELQEARRLHAEARGDADEKSRWAQALDAELGKLREAFDLERRTVSERTEWARKLDAELGKLREAFDLERRTVSERTEWARKLQGELAEAIERTGQERERVETLGKELAALGQSLASEQQLVAERTAWAQNLEKDVASSRQAHEMAHAETENLRAQLRAVLESTCWKLTAPLRWCVLSARRLVERVRRLPKTTKLLLIDRRTGFFDAAWYLQQYPDVRDSQERPFVHYAFHGVFEGRMPNASRKQASPRARLGSGKWSVLPEYLDLVRTRLVNLQRGEKAVQTAFRLLRTQGFAGLCRGIEAARLLQPPRMPRPGSPQVDLPDASHELPRPQLPHFSEPVVSIVIAVYNNLKYTASCIDSIAKSGIRTPYEVIVADDGSSDETAEWCRSITHLRHVVTGSQQGFVLNNNAGAAAAKGKYLLFLNNDTVVHEGWLDVMMECAVKPGVGAVGAKLVYPDGTLQEAGGVIWRDFEGWNYGRNQNPMAPEFNFRRPVDYCSAACLLVAKDIFEKLGGFSKELVPAYGEDSDLCFSIRHHLGLDVLYEPRACVTHFEGKSCGVSLQEGVKKYQTINQRKLAKKWRHITDRFPEASNANSLLGPRKFCGNPVVLIIDDYIPLHDRESGSRRLMSIIEIFQELGCHVMFLPCNLYGLEPYARNLRDKGVELLVCAEGYGATPEELAASRAPMVDIVWCVRPDITERWLKFFRDRNPGALVLFDTGDIHHVRMRREEELLGKYVPGKSLSDEMKTREIKLCRRADRTIAISRQDAAVWADFGAEETKISVISGIYEDRTQSSDPDFESRSGLLFIGSYQHPPNADGAVWFLREIWPMIKKNAPRMTISFLGPNPPSNLRQHASEDIQVAGYVPCVDEFFGNARLFICPLRYGAGIKGKLGQCLEYKLPFVTTTIGAEGMNFRHGFDALIADDPETFANEVLRAYNDEQLWLKLRAGLQDHLQHYSVEAARREIKHIVQARKTPAGKI